jgi:hypothetical protein
METVILKNGAKEAKVLVMSTMPLLKDLMEENILAFYELVMVAREPNHQIFGSLANDLLAIQFINSKDGSRYHMHNSIRNIILSAVEGEGIDLRIIPPIKEE